VTFAYNLTSLGLINQTDKLLLQPSDFKNVGGAPIKFDIRFTILTPGKVSQQEINRSYLRATFRILSVPARLDETEGDGSLFLYPGVSVKTYARKETLIYRRVLMDTQATYDFKITNLHGTPNLLVKIGSGDGRKMTI
jgi:hypothetical protein